MPRYGYRSRYYRPFSIYTIIDLLLLAAMLYIIVSLLFMAAIYVVAFVVLYAVREWLNGGFRRRFTGRMLWR